MQQKLLKGREGIIQSLEEVKAGIVWSTTERKYGGGAAEVTSRRKFFVTAAWRERRRCDVIVETKATSGGDGRYFCGGPAITFFMNSATAAQERQSVAVGPGNAHFISIHQVSSDAAMLQRGRCRQCTVVWPAAAAGAAE